MTPEAAVKTQIKRILVDLGVWYFCPVSNGMGRHGIPDFICCFRGHFYAIEAKAGKGATTALQDREIAAINANGGTAVVINDTDKLPAMLYEIFKG